MEALIRELTTNNRELQQENEQLLAGRVQDLRLIKLILLKQEDESIVITNQEIYELDSELLQNKNVVVDRDAFSNTIKVRLESGEYVHERVQ